MKKNDNKTKPEILRQVAEELAEKQRQTEGDGKEEHETLKLLHELEVHQIELKMQNEELLVAKEDAESLTRKFTELFDFAPTGYFTLNKEGKVMELNLYGANMLGKERSTLKNSQFAFFVSNLTKNQFNTFLENIFLGKVNECCEVMFLPYNQSPIYVQLTGILSENKQQCLITAVDITDRKKKEEEIERSEERYRRLLNILDAGVVVHGADTAIKMSNIRASDLLGLSEDQLKGKVLIDPAWHFIDEKFLPLLPEQYPVGLIKKTKEPLRKAIFGILRPDKIDVIWVVVNGYPTQGNIGNRHLLYGHHGAENQ
jgi:PAS domain S-box-containing protein